MIATTSEVQYLQDRLTTVEALYEQSRLEAANLRGQLQGRAERLERQHESKLDRLAGNLAAHIGDVIDLANAIGEQISQDEGRDVRDWTHQPGDTTDVRIEFHPGEKTQGLPWWFEKHFSDETGVVFLRGTLKSWDCGDAVFEVEFGQIEVA